MVKFWRYLTSFLMTKHQLPIAVILGCTGTGKSKLAIELAQKFGGEIISADSMQVYKGLDIVTNKVTLEEQKQAVHHCIDFLDPLQRYTVVDFRKQCLPILNRLLDEGKIPIIVGGTNYYIESLLWEVLIQPDEGPKELLLESEKELSPDPLIQHCDEANYSVDTIMKHKITQDSLNSIPSLELHNCLKEIDPEMANCLHPEDRRKVIRSLQVYQQTGHHHSELLKRQRSQKGGSTVGGPLRFKRTVMFWLKCEKDVLDKRLDDRVDEMLDRGLIPELVDFHKSYNENQRSDKKQYTEGIFQSIGFKEFHDYLILPEEEKETKRGKQILEDAITEMKVATRQYARKQTKWVTNRFLRKPDREVPPLYGLEVTDLTLWEEKVLQPAINIMQSLIEREEPLYDPLPLEESLNDVPETHFCEICERVFVGRRTWEIHIQSKKHSKRKAGLTKKNVKKKLIEA